MYVQSCIFRYRKVVEQNSKLLSDMKVLKRHYTSTMQNNLYNRPDGFPLKTVEEFHDLEADKDRLQELVRNAFFKYVIIKP